MKPEPFQNIRAELLALLSKRAELDVSINRLYAMLEGIQLQMEHDVARANDKAEAANDETH